MEERPVSPGSLGRACDCWVDELPAGHRSPLCCGPRTVNPVEVQALAAARALADVQASALLHSFWQQYWVLFRWLVESVGDRRSKRRRARSSLATRSAARRAL